VVDVIPLGESLVNITILVEREGILESSYHALDVEDEAV
jgi:hypothetical protein